MSSRTFKLRELLHSDDSGDWGEAATEGNSLLILRAGNIADETWLDLDDVVYRAISEPKRSRLLLRAGDILLERSGGTDTRPVGRVAYIDRDIEAGFSNFLHRIRVNREVADPSYLRFVLAHWHRSGRAVALQTQTTGIRNLMFSRYLDEPIRLPALIIQRKVAAILEAATESLARTDALIAAKREQKRGLMQQLLTGKVRFPGFTEPWKTVRLGDVVSIDPEQLSATTPADYTFSYIDLSSVNNGRIALPTSKTEFASAPSRARRVLMNGDVLLSTVRPLLKGFGILTSDSGPFVGSTGFAVLRATCQEDARFVFECLFSAPVLRQMHARTTGSSYPALGAEDVRELRIPWPSTSERNKIEALLTATTRELQLLEDRRCALTSQRRGLMERLLSGDIAIPSSDTSAA